MIVNLLLMALQKIEEEPFAWTPTLTPSYSSAITSSAVNAWCLWSCETSRANSPSPAQPVVRPHPSKKPEEWQVSSQYSTLINRLLEIRESFQKAEIPSSSHWRRGSGRHHSLQKLMPGTVLSIPIKK